MYKSTIKIILATLLSIHAQTLWAQPIKESKDLTTLIDRLFTQKSERLSLNTSRTLDTSNPIDKPTEAVTKSSFDTIHLKGLVISPTSKPTVWVNGKKYETVSTIAQGIQLQKPHYKKSNWEVPITIDEKTKQLRPGQIWLRDESKRIEYYKYKAAHHDLIQEGTAVKAYDKTTETLQDKPEQAALLKLFNREARQAEIDAILKHGQR